MFVPRFLFKQRFKPSFLTEQGKRCYHATAKSSKQQLMVREAEGKNVTVFDRLLKDRIICLMYPINTFAACTVVAQLLFLESKNSKDPIYLYLNCQGGSISSGLAIYDTLQYIKAPVTTVCIGKVNQLGTLLLSAGGKGRRHALPSAEVVMALPYGEISGDAVDIALEAEEILKSRAIMNNIYKKHTGKSFEEIDEAIEKRQFMTAEEALEFGLIDSILHKAPHEKEKEV